MEVAGDTCCYLLCVTHFQLIDFSAIDFVVPGFCCSCLLFIVHVVHVCCSRVQSNIGCVRLGVIVFHTCLQKTNMDLAHTFGRGVDHV